MQFLIRYSAAKISPDMVSPCCGNFAGGIQKYLNFELPKHHGEWESP